jgi:hypothetical protein
MDNYDLLIISDCNNNININIGDIYEVYGNENSTLLYAEIVSGAKGNKKVILESGLQKIVDIDKVRNIITVELDDKTISVLNDINNKCFNNFNNVLKDVNDDRVNNQTCKNIVNNKLLKLRLDANTDIVITSNNVSQKNKVIDTLDALDTLDTQLQLSLVNVQFVLELESVNLFYAMEPRIFAIKHRCPKVNIYRTDTIPQTALNFNTTKHIFSNKSIFNKATINYDAGGILTEVCKAPEPKCIVSQTSNIKKGKSKVVHDTPIPSITTSASVPTIPSITTSASVPTIPTITTSASVPTIPSITTSASVPTIPTITTSASVPTIPSITTSASVPTIPSITTSASVPTIPSITTSASISTIDNKKEKGKGKSKVVYNTSPLDTSASIPTIDTSAPVLTIDNKKSKSKGKVVNTQTTETKKVRAKVTTSSKKLDIS